ncbi:MAG: peptidase S41, partial [Vulcanococcus sp.]
MAESTDHLLPLVSAAPLVTSPPQNPTPRRSRELKSIAALALSWLLSLWLTAAPALALNDGQQLVVESWRLVNQSYVDPARFDTIHWKRLRQKALERSIQSSADAYDAIEAMLAPIGDPYTRLLRPADFRTLKANTEGSVSGVGLQLGIRQDDTAIVVIAPLEGSPAAEAGISSASVLKSVDGLSTADLGLEATAARLRGKEGTSVLLELITPSGKSQEVELRRRQVDLQP